MRYLVIGGITNKDSIKDNLFVNSCVQIGEVLRDLGHSLIMCSPFKDSADYWVCKGFTKNKDQAANSIELHFVNTHAVQNQIRELEIDISPTRLVKVSHSAPSEESTEALKYYWLLSQLQALESCQIIIAIGGKLNGTANMLLLLAEEKRKPILPFSFMAGAAGQSFDRNRYQLKDKLGDEYTILQDVQGIKKVLELSVGKIEGTCSKIGRREEEPKVFISYPRARPHEADYVETILRRRNIKIFRDESEFGAGDSIPNEINEAILSSNIFIALWCSDYACSPWCFDELEIAMKRQKLGKIKLWILCVDETRIVPTHARNLVYYSVRTREEIEGIILRLLDVKDS